MNDHNVSCRIRLSIAKIKLKVRFTCTISCTLKIQGKELDIPGEVELKNGEANLNSTFFQTTSVNMSRTSAYPAQKKFALLVYLKSSSGRIPAGTVPLPISHSGSFNKREMARIDKCPDKNAVIEYEFSLERIEGITDSHQSVIEKVLYPIRSDHNLRNSAALRNYSPSRPLESRLDSSQMRHLRASKAEGSVGGKETVPIRRIGSKRGIESGYSLLDEYYTKQRDRDASQQKIFGLQREVSGTKTKMSIIQHELNSKAIRVIQLQREAKQAIKKSESLQLELKASYSKLEVIQKSNKDLSNQIKSLKEKMEEDRMNAQNAVKRVQIRQMSCKQQIKSLTEKLYAVENEKQRMLFEKSMSSSQFEERQKKVRDIFKDKEKKMIEERSVLLKKVDSLERDITKSNELLAESKAKATQSMQLNHELNLLVETLQTQNERYRNEASDLRYQLTKSRNERHVLQENLQNNSKFNQERRSYRKQLNQKEIELNQLKDKVNQVETQHARLKASSQQAQKITKDKSNQLKLLERDYNMMMKEHNFLSSQLNSKEIKLSNVLEELQNQMKKGKMLESKCFELQAKLDEEQETVHAHRMDTVSRTAALEEQIQKLNNDLYQCHESMTALEKQNEEFEQLIQQKNELIHNLQSNLIQMNDANQGFQLQKIELAEQKKQIQEELLKKIEEGDHQIKQLNAKISELNQQNDMKLSNAMLQFQKQKSEMSQYGGMIKERQEQMAKTNAKIIKLERELQNTNILLQNCKEENKNKDIEIKTLTEKNNELSKQSSDQDTVLNSLRSQSADLESQLGDLQTKYDSLQTDFRKRDREFNQIKDSFESYKVMGIQALTIISDQVGSLISEVIIEHSDQQFCQKVNDLLHKMVLDNMEKSNKMKQLEKNNLSLQKRVMELEEEKEGKEINLLTKSKDLELLKRSTVQFTSELQNKNSLLEMLKNQTKKKEEEITMKSEEYEVKFASLNRHVAEKNKEIIQLKQHLSESEAQIEEYEDKVTDLELKLKKLQKQKRAFQTQNKQKITQADTNLRLEMERVNQLESGKASLERELKQEKQNVRKALRELQNKCYQYEETEHKLLDCQHALNLKESDSKKFKQLYGELKQITEAMVTGIQSLKRTDFLTSTKFEILSSKSENFQNSAIFQKLRVFFDEVISIFNDNKTKDQKMADSQALLQELSLQLTTVRKEKQKTKIDHLKYSTEIQRQRDQQIAILAEENSMLKEKGSQLSNEVIQKQKQKMILKKDLDEIKKARQDDLKTREKEKEVLMQILKFVDEQKSLIEILRKMTEDIMKTIYHLQRQKKVSMFAMNPIREPLKKLEQVLGGLQKETAQMIMKHKREWDLAALRKKKLSTKQN